MDPSLETPSPRKRTQTTKFVFGRVRNNGLGLDDGAFPPPHLVPPSNGSAPTAEKILWALIPVKRSVDYGGDLFSHILHN